MVRTHLTLYSHAFSGCSARVRIACALKRISLKLINVSVSKEENKKQKYLEEINPNGSIPTMVVTVATHGRDFRKVTITQSQAMLEYLEDAFENTRSLFGPPEPHWDQAMPGVKKAHIRELAALVMCDIQPVQNVRIRQEIEAAGGDVAGYVEKMISRGFDVYESLLAKAHHNCPIGEGRWVSSVYPGKAHRKLDDPERDQWFGRGVTLADVCLVPMVQGAVRNGIDMEQWPRIREIAQRCLELEEFRREGIKDKNSRPIEVP